MSGNVPAIRFAGFTEPWEQRKLGDVATFGGGHTPSMNDESNYADGKILWVTSQDVKVDYLSDTTTKLSEKGASELKLYPPGTLLMVTRSGILRHTLPVSMLRKPSTVNQDIRTIISNEDCSSLWLMQHFKAHSKELLVEYGKTGTTVESVDFAKMKSMSLMLPTPDEQRAIGGFFARLDNLITLHQRKHDQLATLKKSLLEKMFPKPGSDVPELRFAGFTEPWEQRKLGDMGTTYGGLTGKSKEDFGHGAAWFVPYTNVFDNPVGDSTRLDRVEIDPSQNVVRRGDALFTVSSETPEEVGMSSVWPSDLDNLYLNSFCFGYRQDGSFDSSYLAYMLRADSFRNQIEMLAQGMSRFNISKGKVMEIEVPVPDKGEQARIGRLFVNLDSLITLHQRKHDQLATLKKSLLEKMFV